MTQMGVREVAKEKETLCLSFEGGAVVNFMGGVDREREGRAFQREGNMFSMTPEKSGVK